MKKQNLNNLPVRKSIRLKGWNYEKSGFYFVTICTHQSRHLFGKVQNDEMHLSDEGNIAAKIWELIPRQFPNARLDKFIVMPNHIHGIIQLLDDENIPKEDAKNQGSKSCSNSIPSPCTDAINRVRTGRGDGAGISNKSGGITGSKNPMLSNGNLGRIMRWYKGRCTFEIRKKCNPGFGWHGRFYDHIIRNKKSLNRIREYIMKNPENWNKDRISSKIKNY